jgi:hypothetical protein
VFIYLLLAMPTYSECPKVLLANESSLLAEEEKVQLREWMTVARDR